MKSKKPQPIVWLLVILLAGLAGAIAGTVNSDEDNSAPLLVALSINSGEIDTQIEMEVVSNQDSMTSVAKTNFSASNIIANTFDFEEKITAPKLRLKIKTNSLISISGLMITQGERMVTYSPKELSEQFIVSAESPQIENNSLILSKPKNETFYELESKSPIQLFSKKLNLSWAIGTFVLFLLGCYVWIKYRNIPLKKWLFAIGMSLGFSIFSVFLFHLLKEEVKNISLTLQSDNGFKNGDSFEIYYSPSGIFNPLQLITTTATYDHQHQADFLMPNAINRHLRIDLPKNDTLLINNLVIKGWLKTWNITADEFVSRFPLSNDIINVSTNKGQIEIITGKNDPFFQLSNSSLQQELSWFQKKKQDYPYLIGIVVFLLFLGAFSGNYKSKNLFFLSLFGIIILVPSVSMPFKQNEINFMAEKRLAYQFPKNYKNGKEFINQTDSYVKDQFGGRTTLITNWNRLKVLSFNQTNHSSPVIIGKDNWMFYKAEGVQEIYENRNPLTSEKLNKMQAVLEERQAWCALQGIKYYVVFPPIKHTMYPEKLPHRIKRLSKNSKLDQLTLHLKNHSQLNIIDLRPVLRDAKKNEKTDLYYKYDSHWNLLGAYYGYQEIMKNIENDFDNLGPIKKKEDYIWEESTSNDGDLTQLISLQDYYLRQEIVPIPFEGYKAFQSVSKVYPTYESIHLPITYEQADSNLPKLVMNRDSYTNFLIPYMAEHFSRSVYLWTPLFNPEIIREEKPDIVITEMLERFIEDLTIENPEVMAKDIKEATEKELPKEESSKLKNED